MREPGGVSPSAADFDQRAARSGRMRPVPKAELFAADLRWSRRRQRAERRALRRSRWWYPVALLGAVIAVAYCGLRLDQRVAAALVWPAEGAQFVEVGDSVGAVGYHQTLAIVAGGLNRRSGSLVAEALEPSLGGADVRMFSLVYGSGIYDDDISNKFDELFEKYQPRRLILVGSSMGGDVVLNIAAHFQRTFALPSRYLSPRLAPQLAAIYLDCTPLGTADVRYAARTQADVLTTVTEKLGTDGGVGVRLGTELLATRTQWASGSLPFVSIKPYDFGYKWSELWREKLNSTGVSTQLVKDQYGVIRRFDADQVLGTLPSGTNLVFLRPVDAASDLTIDVQQVEDRLRVLSAAYRLDLTVLDILGGSHASAVRDAGAYNQQISDYVSASNAGGVGSVLAFR